MYMIAKIFFESINQAFSSLFANKLRTFLSLIGITIGIFCIISVKSAVDSLENNILDGFSELGTNAIYVEKSPWDEDYSTSYWKYAKYPNPDLDDYEVIVRKSKLTDKAAFNVFTGGKTIKYKSNSVSDAFVMGGSYDFQEIQGLEFAKGRYLTRPEFASGTNKAVLGYKVGKELFQNLDPIGREVKFMGQTYQVIGVLEEEGESMFNFMNFDEVIWVSLTNFRRNFNIKGNNIGESLIVTAKPEVDLENLKSEVTGILRAHRKLKPREKSNFSLMEMSALNDMLEPFFKALNLSGWFIGGFALLVGMFSVANIMFVSVKERTNIIGIKKALGAPKIVILLEFLIEAIILCLIGGLVGLLISYGMIAGIGAALDFNMVMTSNNASFGVIVSIVVGIIAGVVPAYLASRLDPVEAMRQ